MDTTFLLLLFYPDASPPLDPETDEPVAKCRERIELLLQHLSEAGIQVLIPTPVLSELLVKAGPDKARILSEIHDSYAFKVQPFDEIAAIEVAMLTDGELRSGRTPSDAETKAKVKYDRQIVAIAKVAGVKTIYSDDGKLGEKAAAIGITPVKVWELALPPEPPQGELPLPGAGVEAGSW